MDSGYSLREVAHILGLSHYVIRAFVAAGFVTPARGPRRQLRFSFGDLVALRAAQELRAADVSAQRILRALRRLRAQLPQELPATGLRIEAIGDAIAVADGDARWRPDTGQYLFRFRVAPDAGRWTIAPADRAAPSADADAEALFQRAERLEASDAKAACAAYRAAIGRDAALAAAYVNLGRLLHEAGALAEARAAYVEGIVHCARDATLHFNLGVLLEDLGSAQEAIEAYLAALRVDPACADAHYNLSLVYAAAGRKQAALRHFNAYRQAQRDGG